MDLIGRQRELHEVTELLEVAPAVVVTGAPGVGKSALARQLAPVVWVDAERAVDESTLLERLAAALDLPLARWGAVLDGLPGDGVVVVDGAEGARRALPAVLRRLEGVSVVVTSRAHPPPECLAPVLELGPLSAADGAELLRARVRSVRRRAHMPDAALVALAEALDGVPLALELAARRLRLYSPDEVAQQALGDLVDPARPARQDLASEVRAAVEALAPEAREALGIASLLPGAWSAGTLAVAVGASVDEPLVQLLDASLVTAVDDGATTPRFRVLAPVRAVASGVTSPPQRSEALRRLAAAWLGPAEGSVERLDGPLFEPGEVAVSSERLELLLAGDDAATRLRAALVLAARDRHQGQLARTLALDEHLPDEGPRALRVRWAFAVDAAASAVGEPERAEEALQRVDHLLDDEERAAALSARALTVQAAGRGAEALELAQRATALGSDPWLHFRLGAVLMHHGRYDEAASALRTAQGVSSAFRRAQATLTLGRVMRLLGAAPAAVEDALRPAIEVSSRDAHSWLAARVHHLRGVLAADRGDLPAARTLLEEALRQRRAQERHALGVFVDLCSLAWIEGRVPMEVLEPVEAELLEVEQAWLDLARATVHAALDHHAAARALGRPAAEVVLRHGDPSALELVCPLAVALGPGASAAAEELLAELPDAPLRQLAITLVAGDVPPPPARMEERVLVALAARHGERVAVQLDGRALRGADGASVDLSRRRVLSRVLAALAATDDALSVDDLCAAAWPGERMVGQSGTRRVHVAISTLRGLGLKQALRTETDTEGVTRWRLLARAVPSLSGL